MVHVGVLPPQGEKDTGLGALLSLPVSFLGLALFRAWIGSLPLVLPGVPGAGQIIDCCLAVFLLAMALSAKRIVPLCGKPKVHALAAAAGAVASVVMLSFGYGEVLPIALYCVGLALAAFSSAVIILSWCELYSCLDITRVALCLALSFLVEQFLMFMVNGLGVAWQCGVLVALPALCMGLLNRAYAYISPENRPRPLPKVGSYRLPWKLIALFAVYDFVSGMRLGASGQQVDALTPWVSLLVSAFLLIAVVFFSNKFDLAIMYRTPVALLACALLLIPFMNAGSGDLFAFFLVLSAKLFEVVIFLLMCDISRNFGLMALFIFGIEESVVVFGSAGFGLGAYMHSSGFAGLPETVVLLVGVAVLILVTFLLFNDRELVADWGVTLFGPGKMQWNREHRIALAQACERVAQEAGLTARELEVLRLLGEGKSIAKVCEELCIAKGTAKAHTEHIYTKMGINSRRQLLDALNAPEKEEGRQS